MNRCRRCATVISWVIAAGVLSGGVGIGMTAPARADPVDSGQGPGTGAVDRAGRDDSNATGVRRPRARNASPVPPAPTVSAVREGRVVGGRTRSVPDRAADGAQGETHSWPCPWWPFIVVTPPVPRPEVDNGGLVPFQGAVTVTPPLTQLAGGAAVRLPAADLIAAGPTSDGPPSDGSAAGASAPAASPAAPVAVAAPGPPAQRPPARADAAPLSAGPPDRSSGPPQTNPVGQPPEAVRLGYPEYLRQASITELAAVALPGLAALAGLTALGGLLGYRQAKAGYLLRTAGAGRFLQ